MKNWHLKLFMNYFPIKNKKNNANSINFYDFMNQLLAFKKSGSQKNM